MGSDLRPRSWPLCTQFTPHLPAYGVHIIHQLPLSVRMISWESKKKDKSGQKYQHGDSTDERHVRVTSRHKLTNKVRSSDKGQDDHDMT